MGSENEILNEVAPGAKARLDEIVRARGGWRCELHPDTEWPHDDCAGPGFLPSRIYQCIDGVDRTLSNQYRPANMGEWFVHCLNSVPSRWGWVDAMSAGTNVLILEAVNER